MGPKLGVWTILARVALRIHLTPASSVSSERDFSQPNLTIVSQLGDMKNDIIKQLSMSEMMIDATKAKKRSIVTMIVINKNDFI